MKTSPFHALLIAALCLGLTACSKNPPSTDSGTGGSADETVTNTTDFPAAGSGAMTPTQAQVDEDTPAKRLERRLNPVFFAFDKYDLSQASRDTLTGNAQVLRDHPGFDVVVEGHCDERGTNEYNLALGDRRARAARDFLVSSGIPASRFTIVSYGEERPFAYGHDESSWSQNRRAHFRVPEPR